MDTRSTKFKYSFFTKGICLILSALLFFSFVFLGIKTVAGSLVYGFEEYLSGDIRPFYQSYGFETQLNTDAYFIEELTYRNQSDIAVAYDNNREKIINEAVSFYLDEKAKIIYNELSYAVNNYDESYFNYEYTADAVVIPEDATATSGQVLTTSPAVTERTEVITDKNGDRIPRNIEAAKKILENYKDLELLPYAALVRDSAFSETEYQYNSSFSVNSDYQETVFLTNINGYDMDETEIRKHFLAQYEEQKQNASSDAESQYYYSVSRLDRIKSLKYLVIDKDGNIQTNEERDVTVEEFKKNAQSFPIYLFSDGSGESFTGLADHMKHSLKNMLAETRDTKVYIYLDTGIMTESTDPYACLYAAYNEMLDSDAKTNIAIAFISLIISFILLIVFLCLCGHKNNDEDRLTAFIDKLPTDIHFILSIGTVTGLTVFGCWLGIEMLDSISEIYTKLMMIYSPSILAGIFTISYLIFAEWLASTVRIKKAGQKFFAKMLIIKGIFALGRFCRKIWHSLRHFISLFGYKPKKMQRTVIIIAVGYVLGNLIILSCAQLLSFVLYGGIASFIGILVCVAYNCVCVYFMLDYLKKLDMIIDASSKHESVNFGTTNVPESLRILASNLTNTNDALEKAIEKAVRDEQMKTELITNVSHDLKTPLTSLISYSDLLSACDIKDENAEKYIKVINTQSIKLKRLIEDLIEASKVSTGNVTINKTKLNLSELAMQVIAEFSPEMEKNGNEIRFSEPETPPTVMADGAKTYRILSNLLSNAKKYSMPDTRVYISVYTDNINSYFEIKNISCEPLDISPEELTERFVRGDKSRSREGNGLGLSIAKDLCELQNGEIHLHIDGDLFKAVVRLPSAGPVTNDEITE